VLDEVTEEGEGIGGMLLVLHSPFTLDRTLSIPMPQGALNPAHPEVLSPSTSFENLPVLSPVAGADVAGGLASAFP
jgi:hypothetical protein